MIEKKLKDFTFQYDLDTKELWLFKVMGKSRSILESFKIDKTRMFSLMRFMIRVSQRLSSQRRKCVSKK